MRKIKIFKGIESELNPLEEEVNRWLAENRAKIVAVTGNIAPQTSSGAGMGGTFSTSDVLIILVYEEANG